MQLIEVYRVEGSPRRVCICGARIHHGAVGLLAVLAGVVLMWHDWADRRSWHAWRVR